MPDLAASADDDLVELVRIGVVIPDDVPHDVADAVPFFCRDHGVLPVSVYANRREVVYRNALGCFAHGVEPWYP
jgi:hypothetical protein